NASFYGSKTLNSDFSNTDAKDVLFDESRFESCNFSESTFPVKDDTALFNQCTFK
ncbi:MAG: hypothetical protein JNL74_09825, partial [Fibrobacteres bacterium]|nr:hypothetical protein [Fibrobacterota bacterium]